MGWFRRGEFLAVWVLGHLLEGPLHGYELLQRLEGDPLWGGMNPGGLYRLLRELEASGFVVSRWSVGGGPPKRVYRITEAGKAWLRSMKEPLVRHKMLVDEILKKIEEV